MDVSAGRVVVGLRHCERIVLAVVLREVEAAAEQRRLQAACDDDAGLRDMRDRSQVGIEVMRDLSVCHGCVVAAVGVNTYILV